jgi:hypothetical protein
MDRLMVHGAFLLAEDTTFVSKTSKKCLARRDGRITAATLTAVAT